MARRKSSTATHAIERVRQPVVRVVKRTRERLATGGQQMHGGDIAAAMGGAVAGGLAVQGIKAIGASPTMASVGVVGLGGVGAFLLDGKAQAAAVGAAASGLVLGVAHYLGWRNANGGGTELAALLGRAPDRPADLQAAFDAARAQIRPPVPAPEGYGWAPQYRRVG
jgi:hypothetical protein